MSAEQVTQALRRGSRRARDCKGDKNLKEGNLTEIAGNNVFGIKRQRKGVATPTPSKPGRGRPPGSGWRQRTEGAILSNCLPFAGTYSLNYKSPYPNISGIHCKDEDSQKPRNGTSGNKHNDLATHEEADITLPKQNTSLRPTEQISRRSRGLGAGSTTKEPALKPGNPVPEPAIVHLPSQSIHPTQTGGSNEDAPGSESRYNPPQQRLLGADNNTVSAEVRDSQQSESPDDYAGRKNDWDSETNDRHPMNDNRSGRHPIERPTTWSCTSENAFHNGPTGQQSASSASAFEMRVLSSGHEDGPVSQQQKYSAKPENQSVRPAPSITSCLLLHQY